MLESLTLSYLSRINGTALKVGRSKIRPESAGFVTLYRAVNAKLRKGDAIFWWREAVRAGDGVRFEAYLKEDKGHMAMSEMVKRTWVYGFYSFKMGE